MFILSWFLSGFLTALLVWYLDRCVDYNLEKRYGKPKPIQYPSPKVLLVCLVFSCLGFFAAVAFSIVAAAQCFILLTEFESNNWWNTPIIKRKVKE